MISIPVLERLSVNGYGLYPGSVSKPGLNTRFQPGLTLILGANGLGKSTLVLLLYRMCTGPNDIRGLGQGELGNRQFTISRISQRDQRSFAARVHDDAVNADASIAISFGDRTLEFTRSLRNLEITSLEVDGQPLMPNEDMFQQSILEATGLTVFSDWILILQYLVFNFEARRSLVWDRNAQRQLLRLLFLSPTESSTWLQLEREILQLDTRWRNLQAAVTKEEKTLDERVHGNRDSSNVKRRIDALSALQEVEEAQLESARERLPSIEADRDSARLEHLRAMEERESAYRNVEHVRLSQLQAAFPAYEDTAKYILSQILASETCLVCGSEVPHLAVELERRITGAECVICATPVDRPSAEPQGDISTAERALSAAEERRRLTDEQRKNVDLSCQQVLADIALLESSVSSRRNEIELLVRSLPPAEREVKERRTEFNVLRARAEMYKAELSQKRDQFDRYVQQVRAEISYRKDEIKSAFDRFAKDFLLESCSLSWTSYREQVGQSGDAIEFPAFEVDMTGTDFLSPVRRTGAEQVSESQREFIDLAFRMALVTVAGTGNRGTLVVDAPESSLDAVFSTRAARVLMRFAEPNRDNRLILTSNLVDGQLIPSILQLAQIDSVQDPRIVDLFTIAAPTAAIRDLGDEYEVALHRTFQGRTL